MRGHEAPIVFQVGSVDRNPFFSGLFPAFLGFREDIIDDQATPTENTTRRVSQLANRGEKRRFPLT